MFRRERHHSSALLLAQGKPFKIKKLYAEELSVHADLFAHEGGFTPRPSWQVIEAARRQMLTGELSLATTPTTHVYLRDGQVYFAERTTDGGLGVRLLVEGVITRQQMGKGALLVGGVEHLGRMFQRDPSIDRQPVELCVELMTDDVLTSVANDVIDHYTMTMYKRHPNGIDRWLPNRIEVITHIVEGSHLAESDADITAGPGPRRRSTVIEPAAALAELAEVEVDTAEVPIVEPVTPIDEPVVEVAVQTVVAEDAITEELAVVAAEPYEDIGAALALAATFTEHPEPGAMAEAPNCSLSEPIGNSLVAGPDNESGISLAQSAADAIMTTSIADEVAEAVRRALAAIDAAAQPVPTISPVEFVDPKPAEQHDTTASAA